MASITAFTFLGSLSRISSVNRLGTICQERPKGSLIQPHELGGSDGTVLARAGDVAYFGVRKRRGVELDRRFELVVEHEERCHFVHGSVSSVKAMLFSAQLVILSTWPTRAFGSNGFSFVAAALCREDVGSPHSPTLSVLLNSTQASRVNLCHLFGSDSAYHHHRPQAEGEASYPNACTDGPASQ